VTQLPGATITRRNNTANLSAKQAWSGGKAPGSADIALWDSNVTSANTTSLGTNLMWLGIQITNAGGLVTINAGNTLGLGAGGIDMSAATVNFNLNCNVWLGAAQTWAVNTGRVLASTGVIFGSGPLTKSGAGTLTLSGANTYSGGTTINAGTLSFSSASALGTGALTIASGATLQATGTSTSAAAVTLGGGGGAAGGGIIDVTSSEI
jgi:autotransporter-associated beta strand protein